MVTLEIYAGNWRGIVIGQDQEGKPIAEGICRSCHNGSFAPDKFTPWAGTGHAEIFENNLNTNTHYSTNCFGCHLVGYDPGADNNGADETSDYQAFMDSGLINNPGDNWTTVLEEFPDFAQKANIQCENCHGPQDSIPRDDTNAHGARGPEGKPRTSLSADVCASCHGEPLRHVPGDPTASVSVTWTTDETHPQTCPRFALQVLDAARDAVGGLGGARSTDILRELGF